LCFTAKKEESIVIPVYRRKPVMLKSFMHCCKLQRGVSWVLLIYFALFIVPPLSTFAPSPAAPGAPDAGYRLVMQGHGAPMLLFDVILWQNLKKTKQSEEFLHVSPDAGHETAIAGQSAADAILTRFRSYPSCCADVTGTVSPFHRSRSSSIRFTRSGTAPPSFP